MGDQPVVPPVAVPTPVPESVPGTTAAAPISMPTSESPTGPVSATVVAKPGGSNKMWFVLLGVIVLILIVGGGVLFYLNMQATSNTAPAPVMTTDNTNTAKVDDLSADLNSVQEASPDAGFKAADDELGQL